MSSTFCCLVFRNPVSRSGNGYVTENLNATAQNIFRVYCSPELASLFHVLHEFNWRRTFDRAGGRIGSRPPREI